MICIHVFSESDRRCVSTVVVTFQKFCSIVAEISKQVSLSVSACHII